MPCNHCAAELKREAMQTTKMADDENAAAARMRKEEIEGEREERS